MAPDRSSPATLSVILEGRTIEQLEHGLTLVGRAHPAHPHLAQMIAEIVAHPGAGGIDGAVAAIASAPRLEGPQPLLVALDELVATSDTHTLARLRDELPRFSLLLGPIALTVATTLVQRLRQAAAVDRDTYLPDLAAAVNNLAVRQGEAGRRTEALTTAHEAVCLRRELAGINRAADLPDLGTSLQNLANQLAEAARRAEGKQRRAEALAAAYDAAALYSELVATEPDIFGEHAKSARILAEELILVGWGRWERPGRLLQRLFRFLDP